MKKYTVTSPDWPYTQEPMIKADALSLAARILRGRKGRPSAKAVTITLVETKAASL